MVSKSIRHIIICLFALTLFTMFIITPVSTFQQEIRNNKQESNDQGIESSLYPISYNILQETDNTTTINDTTSTETTETTETSKQEFSGWTPFIEEGLYYPLALLFSFGGIFSVFWLIFFVETSKDRTIRERIIGTTIRLIIMCILAGFAIHFWILFEPI